MKLLFLINVHRRERKPESKLVQYFHKLLQSRGVDYTIELCNSLEHARECLDKSIDKGYDTLWIGGGDGSIYHVLNHTFGRDLTYGVVPMGTVNALARSLGIPRHPLRAAAYLLDAKPTPLDVGKLNDRYFLCFASIGFHGAVVHGLSDKLKRRYGKLAFFVSGLKATFDLKKIGRFDLVFPRMTEGQSACTLTECPLDDPGPNSPAIREKGYSFVLSNICNYAGFNIFRDMEPCSGFMELHLFRHNRLWPMLAWFLTLGTGVWSWRGPFSYAGYTLQECMVTSKKRMYLQLDGEAVSIGDDTSYHFQCLPGALRLLVKR